MENALVVPETTVKKRLEESDQSLQLLPKFKDKKTRFARKQNILEEEEYVEVTHNLYRFLLFALSI